MARFYEALSRGKPSRRCNLSGILSTILFNGPQNGREMATKTEFNGKTMKNEEVGIQKATWEIPTECRLFYRLLPAGDFEGIVL